MVIDASQRLILQEMARDLERKEGHGVAILTFTCERDNSKAVIRRLMGGDYSVMFFEPDQPPSRAGVNFFTLEEALACAGEWIAGRTK